MRRKINRKLLISISVLCLTGIALSGYIKVKQKDIGVGKSITKTSTAGTCKEQLAKNQLNTRPKFEGSPSPVNFSNFPEAKTFDTRIKEVVAKGVNFAGHYTFVSWGCGTDCFGYAVIDVTSGNIIAFSKGEGGYHLGDISVNSNVVIFEPVYAGQDRRYYQVRDENNGTSIFDLVCTEVSTKDMYGLPSEVIKPSL
ncbi:hypothetical protein M1555_03920 [Patescibacteria group bacterium]|nr:hypothetical protein [Patescibacteria group bacterium]